MEMLKFICIFVFSLSLEAESTDVNDDWSPMLQYINRLVNVYEKNKTVDCSKVDFYYSSRSTNYKRVKITDEESLKYADFLSKRIMIMVHGWISDLTSPSMVLMKEGATHQDLVYVEVDWSEISMNPNYLEVTGQLRGVARCVVQLIRFLTRVTSSPLENFHLVGHSLGAHVVGFVGKLIQKEYGMALSRVSGLDPAGPLFNFASSENRLDAADAMQVDCVHTDQYALGSSHSICGNNYKVNGGTGVQPLCREEDLIRKVSTSCSHLAAVTYFADSMNEEDKYEGLCCCEGRGQDQEVCGVVLMGYPATPNCCKNIYVNVNAHPPYGQTIDFFYLNNNANNNIR